MGFLFMFPENRQPLELADRAVAQLAAAAAALTADWLDSWAAAASSTARWAYQLGLPTQQHGPVFRHNGPDHLGLSSNMDCLPTQWP